MYSYDTRNGIRSFYAVKPTPPPEVLPLVYVLRRAISIILQQLAMATHFLPGAHARTGGNMALTGNVKLPLMTGGLGASGACQHSHRLTLCTDD